VVGRGAVQTVVAQSAVGARNMHALAVHTLTKTTVVVQVSAVHGCTGAPPRAACTHRTSVLPARSTVDHVLVHATRNGVARARLALGGGAVDGRPHAKSPGATVVGGAHVLVVASHPVGVGLQHAPAARSVAQCLVAQGIGAVVVGLAAVVDLSSHAHPDAGVGGAGVTVVAVAVHDQKKSPDTKEQQKKPHRGRAVGPVKTVSPHLLSNLCRMVIVPKSKFLHYNY